MLSELFSAFPSLLNLTDYFLQSANESDEEEEEEEEPQHKKAKQASCDG